jgi:hypothetical protein
MEAGMVWGLEGSIEWPRCCILGADVSSKRQMTLSLLNTSATAAKHMKGRG